MPKTVRGTIINYGGNVEFTEAESGNKDRRGSQIREKIAFIKIAVENSDEVLMIKDIIVTRRQMQRINGLMKSNTNAVLAFTTPEKHKHLLGIRDPETENQDTMFDCSHVKAQVSKANRPKSFAFVFFVLMLTLILSSTWESIKLEQGYVFWLAVWSIGAGIFGWFLGILNGGAVGRGAIKSSNYLVENGFKNPIKEVDESIKSTEREGKNVTEI